MALQTFKTFSEAKDAADAFFNENFESCTNGASVNYRKIANGIVEFTSMDDPGMEDTFRAIIAE